MDIKQKVTDRAATNSGDSSQEDKANGIHLIARGHQSTRHREDNNPKPIQKDYAVFKHGAFG